MSEDKRLKIALNKSADGVRVVRRVSSTSTMLNDALLIVDEQLEKLRLRSRVENFEEQDIKTLHTLIRSLVDLSKEEREREKAEKDMGDLSKLSHEELLELAKQALIDTKKTT